MSSLEPSSLLRVVDLRRLRRNSFDWLGLLNGDSSSAEIDKRLILKRNVRREWNGENFSNRTRDGGRWSVYRSPASSASSSSSSSSSTRRRDVCSSTEVSENSRFGIVPFFESSILLETALGLITVSLVTIFASGIIQVFNVVWDYLTKITFNANDVQVTFWLPRFLLSCAAGFCETTSSRSSSSSSSSSSSLWGYC